MYTMTEFLTRHDDILTIVTVDGRPDLHGRAVRRVDDLHVRPDVERQRSRRATASSFAENGGTDRHHVPHFLPGQNHARSTEWLKKDDLDSRRQPRAAA